MDEVDTVYILLGAGLCISTWALFVIHESENDYNRLLEKHESLLSQHAILKASLKYVRSTISSLSQKITLLKNDLECIKNMLTKKKI